MNKRDEQIIKLINNGKAFVIKNLKEKDFSFEVTKYIIENYDFVTLVDCFENIPKKSIKAYHIYLIKKLKEIKTQKIKISSQLKAQYIQFIKIDFCMTASEKAIYLHNDFWGHS